MAITLGTFTKFDNGAFTGTLKTLHVTVPVSIVPVGAIVLIEAPGGLVHWSPELVAILAYNCIVTTALGYFLWGKVLSMMPAATAGQVLMLTPIGGFVLSTLIFGGAVTADVVLSVALIVGGIFVTLRR